MHRMLLLLGLCMSLACDEKAPVATFDAKVRSEAGTDLASDGPRGDQGAMDQKQTDKRPGEGKLGDAASDGKAPLDSKPAPDLGPIADWAQPVDQKPAEAAPGTFSASITQVSVWANLMPPAPPDPTHVKLTLTFKNSGSSDITNVSLTGTTLINASGTGYTHALTMKPTTTFSGVVKAGATLTVDFSNVPKTTSTPLPFTCSTQVKAYATVATGQGSQGPIWSSATSFQCTY